MNLTPVHDIDGRVQPEIAFISEPENPSFLQAYSPHDPISIDGNSNFSETALAEGWVGDGSAESPFIIDGYEINRGGGSGHCINISNTRVNFTISNCNLTGASVSPGSGVYLNNVSYGTIINNTCTSNRNGIYLIDSHFNTLANDTCTGNVIGIYMYDSDYNTVEDNDCSGNSNYGMLQYYCDSCVFSSNTFTSNGIDGIHAQYAVSNSFTINTCNGNGRDGIRVWYDSGGNILSNNTCNANNQWGVLIDNDYHHWIPAIVANNTCSSNSNGIYISGSFFNVVNNVVTDNVDCGFEIYCDESTISNNIVERSWIGVRVNDMFWSTLSHNSIVETNTGILLHWADESIISHNSVTETEWIGIELEESNLNHLFLNDIAVISEYYGFDWTGVFLGSNCYDNNITLNRLVCEDNPDCFTIKDYETGLTNLIDSNYYDDYDGSGPYDIHGSAGNVDLNPLEYIPFEPEWIETPVDQVLDYWNQPFYYDVNATAPSPITWQVNDTVQFTIDSTGFIQSTSDLAVGTYGLKITVTNLYGVYISKIIQLIIQEITIPEWIVGPSDVILYFGEGFDYALIATDQSGLTMWTLNDTSNFNISITHLNVTGYENGWDILQITNITELVQGVCTLNVSVSDPYGNTLFGIFTITVLPQHDTTSPIWIVAPLDESLEHSVPFLQRLGAWDESGIHHWWLNDSTYFTIDESGEIRNATSLEVGTYNLEVRAYDPFDNYCSAFLVVTVLETTVTTPTATITTTTTTDTTTSTTTTTGIIQNGFDPMVLLMLLGGTGSAVIVLIVFILYKKKS
jgi:parallel beta-helix repeat protein